MLLLHGVLHLLGYDHELGPEEAAQMAAAEQKIMKKLGWKVCSSINPLLATVLSNRISKGIRAVFLGGFRHGESG